MAWLWLSLAGVLEIVWAIGLKYTDGFRRPLATTVIIAVNIASVWLLAIAAKSLPIGTAYAVWTGIGVIGAAALGIVLFHEPRDAARLTCIGMIVAGIVGLKLVSKTP